VCRGRKENDRTEEKKKTVKAHAGEPANRIALRPSINQALGRSVMPFQKRIRPST
jgi:hypothetical protein